LHWHEPLKGKASQEQNANVLYNSESNKKRRLLTTGLNGIVMEWNILDGSIKSKFNANAAIWDSFLLGKLLFLACEDGSIKVVKIKKDSIVLFRTL